MRIVTTFELLLTIVISTDPYPFPFLRRRFQSSLSRCWATDRVNINPDPGNRIQDLTLEKQHGFDLKNSPLLEIWVRIRLEHLYSVGSATQDCHPICNIAHSSSCPDGNKNRANILNSDSATYSNLDHLV